MSKENTILVVIDNELEELPCLARALQLAQTYNAAIQLFSPVYDAYIAGERFFDSPDLDAAKAHYVASVTRSLEDIADPLRDEGVTVSVDVTWDAPVYEGIVRKVLRDRPMMVVRNNHYHHRLKRSVFSNDDWNLIRTCPVPLMITRPKHPDSDPLRVCAAIDPLHHHDKPAALDALILKYARELTSERAGELRVLHAYDPSPVIASTGMNAYFPVITDVKSLVESVRNEHRDATQTFAQTHDVAASDIALEEGDPRVAIPEFAIQEEIDIVVIGAVSRGFISRALIGHTAEEVLDRMPCDVLIVKPREFVTPVDAISPHRFQMDAA